MKLLTRPSLIHLCTTFSFAIKRRGLTRYVQKRATFVYIFLSPPLSEVNAIARDVCLSVCLSVSKITQKRVHGFGWPMSGHGRTDQLLSAIRIIVRMPELDCFLQYRMHCNTEFYYEGKIPRAWLLGARRSHWTRYRTWSQQRRVVLRRRNTVVGGKCALPSAVLVLFVGYCRFYRTVNFQTASPLNNDQELHLLVSIFSFVLWRRRQRQPQQLQQQQ